MNDKQTGEDITKLASEILRDPNASTIQKTLAGSALSQHDTDHQTSSEMETIASNVLTSDKYDKITRALAASVLSQSDKER